MFELGFFELLLIGVVALLVLGPERLPKAARMAGLWMRRARASWFSLRAELERELADEDLRRSLKAGADELGAVQRELDASGRSIAASLQPPTAQPAAAELAPTDSTASVSREPTVATEAEAIAADPPAAGAVDPSEGQTRGSTP